MMKIFQTIAAIVVFLAVGCDEVVLDGVVGVPLSDAERSKFVGRWENDDSDDLIEVRPAPGGGLLVGSFHWSEERQRFEVENFEVSPRKCGDSTVFLLCGDPKLMPFARIDCPGNDTFTTYYPDSVKVRTAIEAGKLHGKTIGREKDGRLVEIEAASERTGLLLAGVESLEFFEKAEVFRRVQASPSEERKAEPGVGADSR